MKDVSSFRLSRIRAKARRINHWPCVYSTMLETIVLKDEVAIAISIRNYVLKLKERTPVSSLPFFPFFEFYNPSIRSHRSFWPFSPPTMPLTLPNSSTPTRYSRHSRPPSHHLEDTTHSDYSRASARSPSRPQYDGSESSHRQLYRQL